MLAGWPALCSYVGCYKRASNALRCCFIWLTGCHLSTSVVPAHQQQTCLPVVAPSLSNAVYPVVYSEEEFSEYQEALSGRAVASMTTASGSASERGELGCFRL